MSLGESDVIVTIGTEGDIETQGTFRNLAFELLRLSANARLVATAFGLQDTAAGALAGSIRVLGATIYGITAIYGVYQTSANILRNINLALASSFIAVRIAAGDVTAILAIAGIAVAAGVGGYGLAGGFSSKGQTGSMQPIESGSNVQVYIQDANFRGPAETKETVREMGTIMASEFKNYY